MTATVTRLYSPRDSELMRIAIQMHSLLQAIDDRVLVPAADISREQRGEISRELWLMRSDVDRLRQQYGIGHITGTAHLHRDDCVGAP